MSVPWKAISARMRPATWSAMTWTVLAFVLVCTAGTVYVGMQLYAATDYPVQFSTK
ncbi:MAG: hypothetical protein WC213_04065 [Arenimonas sp.]